MHLITNSVEGTSPTHKARGLHAAPQQGIGMQRIDSAHNSSAHIDGIYPQMGLGTMGCQPSDLTLYKGAGSPVNLGNNLPTARHILGH